MSWFMLVFSLFISCLLLTPVVRRSFVEATALSKDFTSSVSRTLPHLVFLRWSNCWQFNLKITMMVNCVANGRQSHGATWLANWDYLILNRFFILMSYDIVWWLTNVSVVPAAGGLSNRGDRLGTEGPQATLDLVPTNPRDLSSHPTKIGWTFGFSYDISWSILTVYMLTPSKHGDRFHVHFCG